MLSGNGRHRRPRQAPAFVVAAGVTGSAIAIPLLGATGASAADGTTWDRVAECESGGSWSASTGNGYFGGLQISQQDWDGHGGLEYATTPDQASRSQQIAVAEKILADRGTTPWATCALLSGLTSKSGSVGVDTGVTDGGSSGSTGSTKSAGPSDTQKSLDSTDSPEVSESSGSTDSSSPSDPAASGTETSPSTSPSSSASPSPSPSVSASASRDVTDGRTDSTEPGGSASSEPGASPKDDSPTEDPESADSDNSWRSGGSWSLVDTGSLGGGRHRGDSADENGASGTADPGSDPSGRHAYTVRVGDTLASIADSLDVDGGWRALYAVNEKAIGADPNHIAPGQALDVGVETGEK
ncbi:transglycosylase family protein [Streptomyces sp. NPDC001508]|uniref:transglycosylase family protein n=1 Tax=Streptomyces sp. NPDC001508 TaxID=3154656 RepID=UPI00331EF493